MIKLAEYHTRIARNQHGAILGFLRDANGEVGGIVTLELFFQHGRLTSPGEELGFTGTIIELPDGPVRRALDCGTMLIALGD